MAISIRMKRKMDYRAAFMLITETYKKTLTKFCWWTKNILCSIKEWRWWISRTKCGSHLINIMNLAMKTWMLIKICPSFSQIGWIFGTTCFPRSWILSHFSTWPTRMLQRLYLQTMKLYIQKEEIKRTLFGSLIQLKIWKISSGIIKIVTNWEWNQSIRVLRLCKTTNLSLSILLFKIKKLSSKNSEKPSLSSDLQKSILRTARLKSKLIISKLEREKKLKMKKLKKR